MPPSFNFRERLNWKWKGQREVISTLPPPFHFPQKMPNFAHFPIPKCPSVSSVQ
jgi:hypothetical protein